MHCCFFLQPATATEDYLEIITSLTFLNGQSSVGDNQQCVTVTILDDEILEDTENFTVLAVGESPVLVTDGSVTIIIHEDPMDCELKHVMCIDVYSSSLVDSLQIMYFVFHSNNHQTIKSCCISS